MASKNKRERTTGRRSKGRFIAIPEVVMESSDYRDLSGNAIKLLLAIAYQYKGNNNGDLSAAYTTMKPWGFSSKATLQNAKTALLEKGLILETRKGRFINPGGICSLYAITWQPIDECSGKLDVKATTTPVRQFSLERYQKQ